MKNIHMLSIRKFMLLLGVLYAGQAYSQTIVNDFQTRTELRISLKPVDKVTLTLIPEVRLDESFTADKYLLESRLTYKPIKGFSLGGSYRFIVNPRDENPTEYLHRFALYAKYAHRIQRWEPSLRIKYTNYTEDASSGEYFRYRAKLKYDIKNCKLTPYISAEGFHDLSANEMYKMRYALGAGYKLNKKNSINIGYMLDYYMQEYRNKHIINIGYRLKF